MNTSTDNGLSRSITSLSPEYSSYSSEEPWFFFSFQTWLIIILVLAFLGINIFAYLGIGLERITNFLKPILEMVGYKTADTAEQTKETSKIGAKAGAYVAKEGTAAGLNVAASGVELVATGAQSGIDLAAKGVNKGIDVVAGGTTNVLKGTADVISGKQATSSLPTNANVVQEQHYVQYEDDTQGLHAALNDAAHGSAVVPDTANSSIQGIGTSNWCFIGEEKGIRNCVEIGVNDRCMSGDIFPSKGICMNPNIRK